MRPLRGDTRLILDGAARGSRRARDNVHAFVLNHERDAGPKSQCASETATRTSSITERPSLRIIVTARASASGKVSAE